VWKRGYRGLAGGVKRGGKRSAIKKMGEAGKRRGKLSKVPGKRGGGTKTFTERGP